jgi:hypothetical protein
MVRLFLSFQIFKITRTKQRLQIFCPKPAHHTNSKFEIIQKFKLRNYVLFDIRKAICSDRWRCLVYVHNSQRAVASYIMGDDDAARNSSKAAEDEADLLKKKISHRKIEYQAVTEKHRD